MSDFSFAYSWYVMKRSSSDNIANGPAVEAGTDVVPGARYAAADGLSHLGLVAGPKAADVSWPHLDRFLTVYESLLYHGGYFGMSRPQARKRAREMMDIFDLRAKAGVAVPLAAMASGVPVSASGRAEWPCMSQAPSAIGCVGDPSART